MSVQQYMCSSFKQELLEAYHNFGTGPIRAATTADTFKIALYTSAASLDATTTVYTPTNEVVGTGYTAGGIALTISTPPSIGNSTATSGTAFISFNNASWPASSFSAVGALIYNSSQGNRAVCVLNFGSTITSSGNTFTVQFPTSAYNTAIVSIGS